MIRKFKLFIAYCIYYNLLINKGMTKDKAKEVAQVMAAMANP
jgi:hypothetical protein